MADNHSFKWLRFSFVTATACRRRKSMKEKSPQPVLLTEKRLRDFLFSPQAGKL